jgi:hypothetical protein
VERLRREASATNANQVEKAEAKFKRAQEDYKQLVEK